MHLEIFVEEESAEAALRYLLPKILAPAIITFEIYRYQGKMDLLTQLPKRLRAYHHWLPEDWRVVVLLDRDQEDCRELKQKLEDIAQTAGLTTRSHPAASGDFQVINRIAIEELEACFFGDVEALAQAYARISPTLAKRARFRDPDNIAGGTWEALERLLRVDYPGGLPKTEVARTIAEYMEPARNRSRSFQVFRQALIALLE